MVSDTIRTSISSRTPRSRMLREAMTKAETRRISNWCTAGMVVPSRSSCDVQHKAATQDRAALRVVV